MDFEKSKCISKTKSIAFQGNPTRIERETQGKSNENPMESKNTQRNQKNNPMQIKRKSKESNVNANKTQEESNEMPNTNRKNPRQTVIA